VAVKSRFRFYPSGADAATPTFLQFAGAALNPDSMPSISLSKMMALPYGKHYELNPKQPMERFALGCGVSCG
jgi:hypothetical protein